MVYPSLLVDDCKVKNSVTLDRVILAEAKLCDTVGELLLTGVIESENRGSFSSLTDSLPDG